MQSLNIFDNRPNEEKVEEKVKQTNRKFFGFTEDQYYAICREYDQKWESVKHLYERKTTGTN